MHDGDTLTVEAKASDGKLYQYKVRLLYVDAPELKQAGGVEAKDHLAPIAGTRIKVRWQEKDRYGRVLGEVRQGDVGGTGGAGTGHGADAEAETADTIFP